MSRLLSVNFFFFATTSHLSWICSGRLRTVPALFVFQVVGQLGSWICSRLASDAMIYLYLMTADDSSTRMTVRNRFQVIVPSERTVNQGIVANGKLFLTELQYWPKVTFEYTVR